MQKSVLIVLVVQAHVTLSTQSSIFVDTTGLDLYKKSVTMFLCVKTCNGKAVRKSFAIVTADAVRAKIFAQCDL